MAFKPNYGQQRADRNRAKEQKRQEKLKRREEKSSQRKTETDGTDDAAGAPPEGSSNGTQ